jgi:hypothetical protein
VRDLESLKNNEDVGLGSMLALLHAHKKFASVGEWHKLFIKIISHLYYNFFLECR